MIPVLQPVSMVGVFGPVASGKTYLMKRWVEQMDRVLIFDTTAEYSDVAEVIERNPQALADRLDPEREDHETLGYRVAYVPGKLENGFGWTVEATWQLTEPRWLVVEEVSRVMSPQWTHDAMDSLIRFSRKRNLGVIGASQRIADVHKDFCANCRMSVLFHTEEARDLEAIAERYGNDAASAVQGLRSLVYQDESRSVGQTPQALVTRRGRGFEVIDVG